MTDEFGGYFPLPTVTAPMSSKSPLQAGTWWLLLVNLLLLAGQAGFGKQAALIQREVGIHLFFLNPFYLITMGCLLLQTLVWPLVLNRSPLSFAYGMNSLNYVNTLAISRLVFGEQVTIPNLLGAGLIILGIWIWSRSVMETI